MPQPQKSTKKAARSRNGGGGEIELSANKPSDDFLLTRIPPDFDVAPIGSCDGHALFGAERRGLFHFVSYQSGTGLSQYHVPHFRIADAISAAAESSEEALNFPLAEGLELLARRGEPFGLLNGEICFLLNGASGAVLARRMTEAAQLLKSARKRVIRENDMYVVARAITQAGNPVSSRARLLMDGIAFERSLLRRLSAKSFGLYSAFCTHRDFRCALGKKSCLKEMLKVHFDYYAAEPAAEDFVKLVLAVQDDFIGCRIWQPGAHLPMAEAVSALASALSKLDESQRTQMVLLNGMHGGSVFLHLGVLLRMISFADYADFLTAPYQPDSEEEQWIRSSTCYTELFGEASRV
ncbi:hypothetical protein [Paludibaculum fermentans]|uniref:Uncharacterized protein n=1 Tax=Paludibaculum fermentans TaxID=1473598 RepID=A0A7S7SIJ2_PALFE|nr:hypothetical protein [Paludibaculum fermentans]QOY86154.1 hypothetical protein IRI77_25535 [Paludibaculum fermentans]